MPMLRDKNRGSGLRNFVSGDNLSADVSEESIMMKRPDNRFWFSQGGIQSAIDGES